MYGYLYGYPSMGGAGAVNGYESAVLSDGGTVVAIGNTNDLYSRLLGLGLINSASLVNSCNGGKANALYNFVPSPVVSLDRFVVTRASTKNVLGSNGLYQSVANNVPAFEFNTDGTYRGLLVEPGATNLVQFSEQLDNAVWGKTQVTVSANSVTSPRGDVTADVLIPNAVSTLHFHTFAGANQTSFVSGTTYTVSVFLKRAGYDFFSIQTNNSAFGSFFENRFDLLNGTVAFAQNTATITALPNGWYRCTVTATATATLTTGFGFGIVRNGNNTSNYSGDETSGVAIWGYQLETGSVATSPIVTTAGTASRVADVVSLTGASSLIGQTEGTIYLEMEGRLAGANRTLISVSDGTNNNRINIQVGGGNTTEARIVSSGVTQGAIDAGAPSASVRKWALRYSASGANLYRDGASVGTPLGAITIPATSIVRLGVAPDGASNFLNGWLRSVVLSPTDIGNASAIALTTP